LPRGVLPDVPNELLELDRGAHSAGAGIHSPPAHKIADGEGRHIYMADFTVRLVRAGILDRKRLLFHMRCEFGISCEEKPPPVQGFFEDLAEWALGSEIAQRERDRSDAAVSYIRQRQARAL
jgi:hypothetical protein